MLLLGIDIGTSSIKVSVVDAHEGKTLSSVQYPESGSFTISRQTGWAEQSPNIWWEHVTHAINKSHATKSYDPAEIKAIGISYQMHGLVCVDSNNKILRDGVVWCDSRGIKYGENAFDAIGHAHCFRHLLNSPGNFTASKLAWVKKNEPATYKNIDKVLSPGDFIGLMLTGSATTTVSALSEGIFWDFRGHRLSMDIFEYFDFPESFIPTVKDVFDDHGFLSSARAKSLSLTPGIRVSYKAGNQLNKAFALNVLHPGELAATVGASGVLLGVSDRLTSDVFSRFNTFAHVNHTAEQTRLGALLYINGTGAINTWVRNMAGGGFEQTMLNEMARKVLPGSNGIKILPFGNGAETILGNKVIGTHISGIDLKTNGIAEMYRATQEAVAFAFRYGLDIMKENRLVPSVIKAGFAGMFRNDVFTQALVNTLNTPVELYQVDGSVGAAMGAGIGSGFYKNAEEAFKDRIPSRVVEPSGDLTARYEGLYRDWYDLLLGKMTNRSYIAEDYMTMHGHEY